MASKADYLKVATQVAKYMNAYGLAFKTYKVSDFDEMIRAEAGGGARVSTATNAKDFAAILQERGFVIFPAIEDSPDGYVRVIRANTVVANLLSAFRYPGADGDEQLAALLRTLHVRRRPDDFTAAEPSVTS